MGHPGDSHLVLSKFIMLKLPHIEETIKFPAEITEKILTRGWNIRSFELFLRLKMEFRNGRWDFGSRSVLVKKAQELLNCSYNTAVKALDDGEKYNFFGISEKGTIWLRSNRRLIEDYGLKGRMSVFHSDYKDIKAFVFAVKVTLILRWQRWKARKKRGAVPSKVAASRMAQLIGKSKAFVIKWKKRAIKAGYLHCESSVLFTTRCSSEYKVAKWAAPDISHRLGVQSGLLVINLVDKWKSFIETKKSHFSVS